MPEPDFIRGDELLARVRAIVDETRTTGGPYPWAQARGIPDHVFGPPADPVPLPNEGVLVLRWEQAIPSPPASPQRRAGPIVTGLAGAASLALVGAIYTVRDTGGGQVLRPPARTLVPIPQPAPPSAFLAAIPAPPPMPLPTPGMSLPMPGVSPPASRVPLPKPPVPRAYRPAEPVRSAPARASVGVARPVRPPAGNPAIADPLSGEALRQALIIDSQRTRELNRRELEAIGRSPPTAERRRRR